MKHFAIVLLLLVLVSSLSITTFAESTQASVDLSGLSIADLIALKDQINITIWGSKDWKEVTVPQGIWEVGKDIPAGHWTIKPVSGNASFVKWCEKLNEHKTDIDYSGFSAAESIVDVNCPGYDSASHKIQVDWELTEGTYIIIDHASVVFTPYDGKPAFTFN